MEIEVYKRRGFKDVLAKPFNGDELAAVVERVCSLPESAPVTTSVAEAE
jgi:DNA-binding response OmpR family regulator